jgi:RNA recognition motif-containing protein
MSGKSRGFGFVEMASKEEGDAAINGLNGKDLKGRTIVVNEARPRTEGRSDRGGRGGDRGPGRGGAGGRRQGSGRPSGGGGGGGKRW